MIYIIGLILFSITYCVHKHTYLNRKYNHELKKYEYFDKIVTPLWIAILCFIFSLIPFLNIIIFMIGMTNYIANIIEKNIYFKGGKTLDKIINFLNTDI